MCARGSQSSCPDGARALLDISSDLLFIVDMPGGEIRDANLTACRRLGRSRESLLGDRFQNCLSEKSSPSWVAMLSEFAAGKAESKNVRVDVLGQEDAFMAELVAQKAVVGGEGQVVVSIRDLSDRLRAEQACQIEERIYETLVNNVDLGITLFNQNFEVVKSNTRHDGEGDKPACEFVHHHGRAGHLGGDQACPYCPGRTAMASRRRVVVEAEGMRRDNDSVPVQIRAFPVIDSEGQTTGFIEVVEDTSKRKQAEEERDRLFNLSLDMLSVGGFDGHFRQLNPVWETVLGWTREELTTQPWMQFVHGDDIPATIEAGKRLRQGRAVVEFENRYKCRDGSYRWLSWSSFPLTDEGLIFSVARDITERKQSEEALREIEQRLSSVLDHASIVLWAFDSQGVITTSVGSGLAALGQRPGQIVGQSLFELYQDNLYLLKEVRRALAGELFCSCAEIAGITFDVRYAPLLDDSGEVVGALAVAMDTTERQRARDALQSAVDIVEAIPSGLFIYQYTAPASLVLLDGNSQAERLTGIRIRDWQGHEFNEIWPAAQGLGITEAFLGTMHTGEMFDTLHLRYDDEQLGGDFRVRVFRMTDQRLGVAFENISDYKRAERALVENEARLQSIFRAAPIGMGVVSDRILQDVNHRLCEMSGYSSDELLGKSSRLLYPTQEDFDYVGREKYRQIRETGTGTVETRWRCKDGTLKDVLLSSTPIDPEDMSLGVTFTALDITVRKQAAAVLARAARVSEQLRQLMASMNACHTLDEMLELLLEAALDVCQMDGGAVYRVEGDVAVIHQHRGLPAPFLQQVERVQLAGKIVQRVGQAEGPIALDETSSETLSLLRQFGMEYAFSVPLRAGRELFGFLNTACTTPPSQESTQALRVLVLEAESVFSRLRVEDELRRSEERFRSLVETTSDWIWEVDARGIYTYASPKVRDFLGYTPDEVLGKTPFDFMPPAEAETVRVQFEIALDKCAPLIAIEKTNVHKDGRHVVMETNGVPVLDKFGTLIGYRGIDRSVTDRKRAQEELAKTQRMLAAAIEQTPAGIIIADAPDVNIRVANPASLEIRGDTLDPLTGIAAEDHVQNWQAFHPDGRPFDPQDLPLSRAVLEGVTSKNVEVVIRRSNGEDRHVLANAAPVRNSIGEVVAGIVVFPDVTDRKRVEEEVRRLNAELEQRVRHRTAQLEASNRELEAFAYSVSHDLRAPLRHIDGFTTILQRRIKDSLDATNQRYLENISRAATRMGTLIDDLLAFSRMGRADMHCTSVDLAGLVQEVLVEMEPDVAGRNIQWQVGDLPAVVADPSLLRQVLLNLLSNAVKFTAECDEARVEVDGWQEGDRCVVLVRDNGVGFDMKYVDKLFGLFQRLHDRETFPGNGVGLANVRRIIHRHGGSTWAEGAVGKGATFFLSLPLDV